MNIKSLLSFQSGREALYSRIASSADNWQKNTTPLSVIRRMVAKTITEQKNILVLFNIEFLEVLVNELQVDNIKIYYIADNELEHLTATNVFKVNSYLLSDFTTTALRNLIKSIKMNFDIVFSNPPYNKNVDIKILNEIVDVADEFVIVHPSTWLVDLKDKTPLYKTFKSKIDGKVSSVELFNGNPIFNIQIFMPCVITHIDKKHLGAISVNNFNELYETESIFEITKFGKDWETIVKPFKDTVEKFIANNDGHVWERFANNKTNSFVKQSGFLLQLPMGRGHENQVSHTEMVREDFYGVFSNDENEVITKNKCQDVAFKGGTYCYFPTEEQRNNCVDYLKTDFARFCLAINKLNKHIDSGELELIPWLDFSEEWNDEKLFKFFDISLEQQIYIRKFLPDYYRIR